MGLGDALLDDGFDFGQLRLGEESLNGEEALGRFNGLDDLLGHWTEPRRRWGEDLPRARIRRSGAGGATGLVESRAPAAG
jgi:hypothetical protein